MIKVGAGRARERLTPFFRLEQLALSLLLDCVCLPFCFGDHCCAIHVLRST